MQTKSLYTELESKLHQFLIQHCPTSVDSAPFLYASLPAGKLFRPLLACAIANDINNGPVENNLFNFAIALELHHTYTLIHDDLPCMDDDDIRRGRPSTHKKFNEWIAILTGDGLLNLSYRALAEIDHPSLSSLIKFFSWALGPKGLIQGQVFDLSEDCQKSFTRLLRMHELKTGRLLQVAILGATLLSNEPDTIPLKETKNLLRLGSNLGIVFQLLDDLNELTQKMENKHEIAINPFFLYPQASLDHLIYSIELIKTKIQDLNSTKVFIYKFLDKSIGNIKENEAQVQSLLKKFSTNKKELDFSKLF